MNLLYDNMPESIEVDGKEYLICTDFRDWVQFVDLMEDGELNEDEKIECALKWFTREIPKNFPAAFQGLFWFFSCGESCGKGGSKRPVFSFRVDAPYIIAVSYTHLDVYKRQAHLRLRPMLLGSRSFRPAR